MSDLLHNLEPLVAVLIFLYGLVLGSFLNVCIYRLARYENAEIWDVPGAMRKGGKYHVEIGGRPMLFYCDEVEEKRSGKVRYVGEARMSVVRPRSACPGCGHAIAWYENVPVLSWLVLRGRCRHCQRAISPRYLLVELLTGVLFVACYAVFGLTLAALEFAIMGFLLLGLFFTDAEKRILPDALTFPGIALGLVFALLVPVNDVVTRLLGGTALPLNDEVSWRVWSLGDAVLAAALGAVAIWALGAAWKILRGVEAMGLGDVKLVAMLGAFLGLKLMVFVVFAASLAATAFGLGKVLAVWLKRARRRMIKRHEGWWPALGAARSQAALVLRVWHLPFGSFLSAAALAAMFVGNRFWNWYLGQFR